MPGSLCNGEPSQQPLLKESKAYCEGRAFHAGNGIANPITGNPFPDGLPTDQAAWDKGWQDRQDSVAGTGGCCQSEA